MTDVQVTVFDNDTELGFSAPTDPAGEVQFNLPAGSYRFQADLNGTFFWSEEANHCLVPGCEGAGITVTKPVTVTVLDWEDAPQLGIPVSVYDGLDFTGYEGTTDAAGEVVFTLPVGDYRFQAVYEGEEYWSDDVNHCALPGCESINLQVGIEPTPTPTVTYTPTATYTATPTPTYHTDSDEYPDAHCHFYTDSDGYSNTHGYVYTHGNIYPRSNTHAIRHACAISDFNPHTTISRTDAGRSDGRPGCLS